MQRNSNQSLSTKLSIALILNKLIYPVTAESYMQVEKTNPSDIFFVVSLFLLYAFFIKSMLSALEGKINNLEPRESQDIKEPYKMRY